MKKVIAIMLIIILTVSIISVALYLNNKDKYTPTPTVSFQYEGNKSLLNLTVTNVITNYTGQNDISNFAYSIYDYFEQNRSWKNLSEIAEDNFVELYDMSDYGNLSLYDRIIINITTLHYRIFSLRFIPSGNIVYNQHLINYDLSFNNNLTGIVYVDLVDYSSEALDLIQENGGTNIEKESSTTVSVRVYDPDKPGDRLEQVNKFVNNLESSSLIVSIFPLEYQNHNLTGEVLIGINEGVLLDDAILVVKQCGSISQYPGVNYNPNSSSNYIVATVYEPILEYPNATADAIMFPSLRNFIMLIDSSPLVRYVEPDHFVYPDWEPVP